MGLDMADMDSRAVIVADAAGIIRFWSLGAEAMLGHRSEDVVGKSVELLIPEFFREQHWAGFHAAMRNAAMAEPREDFVVPVEIADGTIEPAVSSLSLIRDAQGGAVGAIAVMLPQD